MTPAELITSCEPDTIHALQRVRDALLDAIEEVEEHIAAITQQPVTLNKTMVERIAALLYEETTGEPWTVASVEHYRFERDYYRRLARKVAALATHRKQGGE